MCTKYTCIYLFDRRAAWTTYGKPARDSVLSATWRLWAWRAERGWGPGGPRDPAPGGTARTFPAVRPSDGEVTNISETT